MDVKSFTEALESHMAQRLEVFDIRIEEDHLPVSVKFLVISESFVDLDRAARIQLLADMVEAAFGLPLKFRPMGLALTRKKAWLNYRSQTGAECHRCCY